MENVFTLLAITGVLVISRVSGHPTPCNQGNDTLCLNGVRTEFTRKDSAYWFGSDYAMKCPNGPDGSFFCTNSDPSKTSIAERLLGSAGTNFDVETIEQFLRIRFNTPRGSYMSCGHRFTVEPYQSTTDLDNTHTLYYDMWMLDKRPSITFDYIQGEAYTLIAYDAGQQRIGGMWVNIMSSDTATGEEVIPHWGPRNAMWEKRNPFVYALFRQKNGQRITTASSIRSDIITKSINQNSHYYLEDLIKDNNLEGPIGVGYVVVKTDPYGILEFKLRNLFNNCPYLVSKNPAIIMALRIMDYQFTDKNSYTDYRGTFLTHLEVDMTVRYRSDEAHFDSCCQHVIVAESEVTVDPFSDKPLWPVYTRADPEISFVAVEMQNPMYFQGKMFTLLMLDVTDASVNATNPDTILHWQVLNIPGNNFQKGDVVKSYLPPVVMMNDTRQFLFLLLKQKSRIDPQAVWPHTGSNCPNHFALRCHFDFGAFQRSLNLEIVGLSHFLSKQDPFSRAVMYGAIRPRSVAQSMEEFTARPGDMNNGEPMMTKEEVCAGQPGYADPCPNLNSCNNGSGQSQGQGNANANNPDDPHAGHT